jgi:hypothetical protein
MATDGVAVDASVPAVSAPVDAGSGAGFRPSIIDRFLAWLDALPGPTWLAYAVMVVAVMAYLAVQEALRSGTAAGFDPTYLAYAFFYVFPLAAYASLSSAARSAWHAFRPATDLSDADADEVALELSSTPARATLAVILVSGASYVVLCAASPDSFDLVGHPIAYVVLRLLAEALIVAPLSFVLVYLVVRQLRIVSRLHRSIEHVDVLRPAPMHAMSRLTARAALLLVIIAVAAGLPLPGTSDQGWLVATLLFSLPLLILAAAVFVVPLRGMQARLAADRRERVDDVSLRLESAVDALHTTVADVSRPDMDAEELRTGQLRADALTKSVATLISEREFLRHLPTAPWEATTLRAVASALALPIVLFLLTRALGHFV